MNIMEKIQANPPECLTITVDEAAVVLGISRSSAYQMADL